MNMMNQLAPYEKVIIYGAGKVGRAIVEKLKFENPELEIFAVAVSDKSGNPDMILDIPVVAIDNLSDFKEEAAVVIATMEKTQLPIKKHLDYLGFPHVFAINDEIYEKWKENVYYKRYVAPYLQVTQQLYREQERAALSRAVELQKEISTVNIPRLVVVLGTRCSLRCKDCNNLMPYFKPQKDLDSAAILRSLWYISDKASNILKCELIGGEPFLSGNLKDTLQFLLDRENIHQVEITTNGMIMPEPDLLPLLQHPKVTVRISDYGKLVDREKMISFLKNSHVNYVVLCSGRWIFAGGPEKRGRSIEELEECYNLCEAGYYCKTLYEEKLFSCARGASLYALGYLPDEYLEINQGTTVSEIRKFIMMEYSIACDYCDMGCRDRKYVNVAEQLDKKDAGQFYEKK